MQQQQFAAQLAHSGGRHLNLRRSMSPGAASTTGSESSISLGAPSPGPPSMPPLPLQSLPPPPLQLSGDPPRIGLTNPSPCTLPQPLALHRPFTWYSPPHPPITAGWWRAFRRRRARLDLFVFWSFRYFLSLSLSVFHRFTTTTTTIIIIIISYSPSSS